MAFVFEVSGARREQAGGGSIVEQPAFPEQVAQRFTSMECQLFVKSPCLSLVCLRSAR